MVSTRTVNRLRELAASAALEDQCKALIHKDCPADLVSQFLNTSEYSYLRTIAVRHPNLPYGDMKYCINLYLNFCVDPSDRTAATIDKLPLLEITHNNALPEDLIRRLPVEIAGSHPNCPDDIILDNWDNQRVIDHAAYNDGISETIQLRFILSDATLLRSRQRLAHNPAVTTHTLSVWIPRETNLRVLRLLLQRPNATPDQKQQILDRHRELTRDIPAFHDPAREKQYTIEYSTDEIAILNALFPDGDTTVTITNVKLKRALSNPCCPTLIIMKACYSPKRGVRRTAIRHPRCPEEGRVVVGLMG